jgi:hypothetical protein
MKLRTLVISVALLAVLSVVVFFRNRPEPVPPADPRVGTAVLDPDTVSKAAGLVISDQGKKVELSKGADAVWHVTSYFDMPADFYKISKLVQDLNESKVERLVTDNPERMARLEFKDSFIALKDSSGTEIWKVTLGKTPESGNGRFIRFGGEPKAFFSGMHVWLDTDAKGWADAQLVTVKPEDVAKLEIPLPDGKAVVVSRPKKDAAWSTPVAPAGQTLISDKISPILTTLTGLRFSDSVDTKDASAAQASKFMRTFRITTFDGKTVSISLGRKPEEKKLKAPTADTAAIVKADDGKPDAKPIVPDFETIPAGPVFVEISSSDPHAGVNDLMKRRSFEVDDYSFTGLPQKADELFEAAKAKQ